jgi:hypothetical protein
VTVGKMPQLSYTFNYGQIPMHCDVTHIRITTKQVGLLLLSAYAADADGNQSPLRGQ